MMVIWVLVILLLSLLIILLLPVSVQTTATLGDGLQCTGQIRWAAGLVKARFQLGGETTTTTVQLGLWDRPWQPRKRTKKRKRTLPQLSQLQPFLTTAVWQAVSRFLRQLLAALRLRWRVWGGVRDRRPGLDRVLDRRLGRERFEPASGAGTGLHGRKFGSHRAAERHHHPHPTAMVKREFPVPKAHPASMVASIAQNKKGGCLAC